MGTRLVIECYIAIDLTGLYFRRLRLTMVLALISNYDSICRNLSPKSDNGASK